MPIDAHTHELGTQIKQNGPLQNYCRLIISSGGRVEDLPFGFIGRLCEYPFEPHHAHAGDVFGTLCCSCVEAEKHDGIANVIAETSYHHWYCPYRQARTPRDTFT